MKWMISRLRGRPLDRLAWFPGPMDARRAATKPVGRWIGRALRKTQPELADSQPFLNPARRSPVTTYGH